MKLLFLCSQNRLRSPTAERIFRGREGLDVRSAGLDQDAVMTASDDLVAWADMIFVMEKAHVNKLRRRFKTAAAGKRVVCLHIPDEFECMDPELIRMLETRVAPWLSADRVQLQSGETRSIPMAQESCPRCGRPADDLQQCKKCNKKFCLDCSLEAAQVRGKSEHYDTGGGADLFALLCPFCGSDQLA